MRKIFIAGLILLAIIGAAWWWFYGQFIGRTLKKIAEFKRAHDPRVVEVSAIDRKTGSRKTVYYDELEGWTGTNAEYILTWNDWLYWYT